MKHPCLALVLVSYVCEFISTVVIVQVRLVE